MNPRLSRRKPSREPARSVLVLVEGAETETQYLNGVLRALDLKSVEVRGPAGVPKSMVETAVEEKPDYDEVWCVFDVDSHPRLNEALEQARANKINVALSNPCFEVFLLLHYRLYTKPCDRREVIRELRKYIPKYDKKIDFGPLWLLHPEAAKNNEALTKWHRSRGTVGNAPSTGVFQLIDRLEKIAKKFRRR